MNPKVWFTSDLPERDEREVGLELSGRLGRREGGSSWATRAMPGRAFAEAVADLKAMIVPPHRIDEPGSGPHLAPIRQRIESIFWICKDLLTLERHGARTLAGGSPSGSSLAAGVWLNHQLGRPSRSLVAYVG